MWQTDLENSNSEVRQNSEREQETFFRKRNKQWSQANSDHQFFQFYLWNVFQSQYLRYFVVFCFWSADSNIRCMVLKVFARIKVWDPQKLEPCQEVRILFKTLSIYMCTISDKGFILLFLQLQREKPSRNPKLSLLNCKKLQSTSVRLLRKRKRLMNWLKKKL